MRGSLKLVLDQKRTISIVSKFENAQYKGGRPVQLKPIPRGISSEWYAFFFSYNFIAVNTCHNVQIMHKIANIDENPCFV